MFQRLKDIWQAIKQFIRANDRRRDDDELASEVEADRRQFRTSLWQNGKQHDIN